MLCGSLSGPRCERRRRIPPFQSTRGSQDAFPHVWLTRLDGSDVHRLSSAPGERPTWSPDGTQILFTAGDLFVARRGEGSRRRIAVAVRGEKTLADWGHSG